MKITQCTKESCDNCRNYPIILAKRNKVVEELNQARSAHPTNSQLIQALEKKLNALESELTPLQLHAKWLEQNRPYIEKVTEDLSWGRRPDTIQLIVDFGKIYASDSRACKTLVWSMYRNVESALACGDRRLEWLDNWFRHALDVRPVAFLFYRS